MANDKRFVVKNGLQTQNILFQDSPNGSNQITIQLIDSDTLSFEGDAGQLFSITDTLSGTIFAVNDISGIPSFEIDDDGTVRIAEFSGNVLIGTDSDDGVNKLQLNGSANFTGSLVVDGTIQADSFVGQVTGNAETASALLTARDITLSGDVSGSTSFDGSSNVTITTTIQPNSVALGTDTTGHYVATGATGNGLTGSVASEGGTFTVTMGTPSTLTASTTNATTASSHTHAIDESGFVLAASQTTSGVFDSARLPSLDVDGDTHGDLPYSRVSGTPTIGNGTLTLATSGNGVSGSASFTANQTGGSTFTVNSNATSANTANTIVYRDASGNFSAGTITADLNGNASTATSATSASSATTATNANNINVTANTSTDTTTYPLLVGANTTGNQSVFIDNANLSYNASTNTLTATTFNGALSGNASTATALATGRTISLSGDVTGTSGSFDGTGNVSITATVVESNVNHDLLSNFVANEHINHSSVTLTAGDGLSGGGDITASRSFAVDATVVRTTGTQSIGGAKTFTNDLTVDAGTNTTLAVVSDDAGISHIRAYGAVQGTGVIEVGQSTSFGGGISYNGDGSPAFAAGETADNITFFRRDTGTVTEVFSYPYNSNTVTFNGTTVHSGGVSLGGHTMNDIDITSEYSGANDHLMTAQAINNRILDFGYTTNTGTVTSVTGGSGLTGSVTTTGSLAVGAGDGITVNADDVAVDGTVMRTDSAHFKGTEMLIERSTSPTLRLNEISPLSADSESPRIIFDTTTNQGVMLYHDEYDTNLPVNGYGLILGPSPTNTQFPGTGTLTLNVLGDIYAGATTLGALNRVLTTSDLGNGTLTLATSGTGISGSASFTANQSGGSTFTVTSNATSANTASTIVARDGSGNFTAGTITAALSGNASTATALQTGRTISLTGDVTGTSGSFDGTGNVSITATVGNDTHTHNANNLTGTTLASGVVNSSLTSVGTLTSLSVSGGATAVNTSGTGEGLVLGNSTFSDHYIQIRDDSSNGVMIGHSDAINAAVIRGGNGKGFGVAVANSTAFTSLVLGDMDFFIDTSGNVDIVTGDLEVNGTTRISNAGAFTAASLTLGGHTINDIDITSEYSGANDHLMTAQAINNRILDFGYTTNTGTVTSVAAGNGMFFSTITGTGSVSLGTPGTLSGSTTNSVSTNSHTHFISTTGTGNIVAATSPALSGTPTAPTASTSTNTTQIATTAFVQQEISANTSGPSKGEVLFAALL